MREQVKLTISVPSDATDFKAMVEILGTMGMKVESIHQDLGLIRGKIFGDLIKTIKELDGVSFIFEPVTLERELYG